MPTSLEIPSFTRTGRVKRGADVTLYPSAVQLARSWDRDRDLSPIAKRTPPVIETWRCACCLNEWTEFGSFALGFCTRCHTPDPRRSL